MHKTFSWSVSIDNGVARFINADTGQYLVHLVPE